jgi:hypothetical protein
MTAVEFLQNQLKKSIHFYRLIEDLKSKSAVLEDDIFAKANKMFEQQIYQAFYEDEKNAHKYKSSPTLYYNETFKK